MRNSVPDLVATRPKHELRADVVIGFTIKQGSYANESPESQQADGVRVVHKLEWSNVSPQAAYHNNNCNPFWPWLR